MKTPFNFIKYSVLLLLPLAIMLVILFASTTSKSEKQAKYQITSENGKRYYANGFRIYGRGIIFDDVNGNKVIVQGDLEIVGKGEFDLRRERGF